MHKEEQKIHENPGINPNHVQKINPLKHFSDGYYPKKKKKTTKSIIL